MTCCLTTQCHFLNNVDLIICEISWHSPEGNFTINSWKYQFIKQVSLSYTFTINGKSHRNQWVKESDIIHVTVVMLSFVHYTILDFSFQVKVIFRRWNRPIYLPSFYSDILCNIYDVDHNLPSNIKIFIFSFFSRPNPWRYRDNEKLMIHLHMHSATWLGRVKL